MTKTSTQGGTRAQYVEDIGRSRHRIDVEGVAVIISGNGAVSAIKERDVLDRTAGFRKLVHVPRIELAFVNIQAQNVGRGF